MIDIKAKAEEIVAKVKGDKDLMQKFRQNPIPTIESLLGIDLPDDMTKKLVDIVKTKLTADQIGDIAGKLGGFLGKK